MTTVGKLLSSWFIKKEYFNVTAAELLNYMEWLIPPRGQCRAFSRS